MRYLCIMIICLSLSPLVRAQQTEVFFADIHTVQVVANNDLNAFPIIALHANEWIDVSFDQLSHEYRRYRYVISHHNADWSPSNLHEIDFLDGFNNIAIENYETSRSTTVEYTHYTFRLPNEQAAIRLSGNYMLTVYADYEDEPIFRTSFRVLDKKASVSSTISTNTDIDRNNSHQQVSFSINYGGYAIRNPQNEVKVQVLQNRRTDNMVSGILPSYVGVNELRYEYNRELIFRAGNEYRRFEMVSTRYTTSGVDYLRYIAPYYHVVLYPDEPRTKNYIYDEDQNGRYLIRNTEAVDNDTEADYFLVHFSLPWEDSLLRDGNIYLQGAFTYTVFNSQTQLIYNPDNRAYESTQLLKQGAYNYQYVYVPHGSRKGYTGLIEGNYYQTENEYLILVYHRPFGERYDKLIGYTEVSYR